MRVFVSRRIPENGLNKLREHAQVDVWPGDFAPSRKELLERVAGCDGLLTLLNDTIDGEVMDAAGPQLRVVSNFAVGFNNIDLQAAGRRKISVGNTPDVLTDATADIALGLMLAAARRFQESIDQVRNHQWKTWEPLGLIGQDLRGKTLGIVGMGRIGQAVAQRCVGGWQMKVIYTARKPKPEIDRQLNATQVSFEQLLDGSDFVSVHTDLNAETKHLFNAAAFHRMKPNAVFINTARGGVVDQVALADALRAQTIFAAGLDVTDPEPLPADSTLRGLANCIILPHIGSATFITRQAMSEIAADNLIAGLQNKPLRHAVPLPRVE
jgi:glyoxylate reductase